MRHIRAIAGEHEGSRLERPERAFLVGAQVRGEQPLFTLEESLDELERLAYTAGLTVVGRAFQNLHSINPATYIGVGKAQEIRDLKQELVFDVVVFDNELSAAQLRNLEEIFDTNVLDRTALILDIFALHANTKEGALQVELAQYVYRLPRLTRRWTHLSRQAVGGVGLRGPGETQLESDRRDIRRRMTRLKQELEEVRKQRDLRRSRRRLRGLPVAAIVGYTNAGKSTLLNRLTDADVLVEDKLFATLDPTTRKVELPSGKEILFTDTVGFIQKLPTQLVAAFHATLEEVHEADILVHVVDIQDRNLLQKVDAVNDVLQEIDASDKPTIIALNKIDLIDPEVVLNEEKHPFAMQNNPVGELQRQYRHVIPISAEQGVGIEDLLVTLEEMLLEEMEDVDLVIPYKGSNLLDLWHKQGIIEREDYAQDGIHVHGKLPKRIKDMVQGNI
ncbi:MAG: GTPase HflX [Chloroflexota bacterium]|nr:GTPase HflX [Chloroflexota bacterium]